MVPIRDSRSRIPRGRILLGLILTFALVAAACGDNGTSDTESTTSTTDPVAGNDATAETATITIAVPTDPATMDPNGVTGVRDLDMYINLFSGLTRHVVEPNPDAPGHFQWSRTEVEPSLAESIDISDDGTVYTFGIRQGLNFPSGNPLTAEDFRYSWERGLAAPGSITEFELGVAEISDMSQVQVLDDFTLQLTLPRPNPRILRVFALSVMSAVDSALLKSEATDDDPWANEYARTNPAGYGPYVLESNEPGSRKVFVPNPDWWEPSSAGKSTIVYQIVPTTAQRLLLVQEGAVDMAFGMSARSAEDVADDPNLTVLNFETLAERYLAFQQFKEPFGNPLVREAMAHAIDYQRIIDEVYFGAAVRMLSGIPVGHEGFLPSFPYDEDIDLAKALLTEAGFPNGFDAELMIEADLPAQLALAVQLQGDLARIGINITPAATPGAEMASRLGGHEDADYELVIGVCTPWLPEPWYTSNLMFHSGNTCSLTYENPIVDTMVEDMKLLPSAEEVNKLVAQVQAIWSQDIGYIPLVQPNQIQILRSDLRGFLMTNEDESIYFAFLERG
jgi:peptide/nickel transport system substrate-binding protein